MIDTTGFSQLRIANGMYPLPTPRNFLMVAPQVFQGKKLDVMVPESSRHLDRFFGSSLKSSKASLNILPGSTSAKYWSQQIAFTKIAGEFCCQNQSASAFSNLQKKICKLSHDTGTVYDAAETHCAEDNGDGPEHTLHTIAGK